MSLRLSIVACLALLAGCDRMRTVSFEGACGFNPVVSPDGASLALERHRADGTSLVVVLRRDGTATEVDPLAPSAFHPCWAPDGSLYYACNTVTNTAYEKWIAKAGAGGCVIRRWKDGAAKDVLASERRDFLPFVSADGKSLFFSSTRWTKPKGTQSTAAQIGVADLDGDGRATNVRPLRPTAELEGGEMQCVVSPDGRYAVWAEMRDSMDGWRLFGARVDAPQRSVNVLPEDFVAYAPRWCGDSRRIAFTGFREGDDGWQVYVADVFSGGIQRIGPGKDPCWMPDGQSIVFERNGVIHQASVGKIPFGSRDEQALKEKIVWRKGEPFAGDALAFRDDRTIFVRVRVRLPDEKSLLPLFRAAYAESDQALQLYRDKEGALAFATRTAGNRFHWVRRTAPLPKGKTLTVTGIRTRAATYLSVDGDWPARMTSYLGTLDLRHPERVQVGADVVSAEVGLGWPSDVPSVERKAVFE